MLFMQQELKHQITYIRKTNTILHYITAQFKTSLQYAVWQKGDDKLYNTIQYNAIQYFAMHTFDNRISENVQTTYSGGI